ncbi:MAG: hypothetical protein IJ733_18815 [Lachnospiraceae bacterium]|nr:hypothetical protein [Lachnospiraceae bacterium]
MSMEISNEITSQVMDLKTSKSGVTRKEEIKTGFNNVDNYSKYLQEKYDYMNAGTMSMKGIPTTVNVSSAFLKKCMDNPEKAAWLEENVAAIPKCNEVALSRCLGTLTNISYKIDANGNMSMAISGTNDPDGKIARENAKRKVEEKKAAEEKAAKRREKEKEEHERIEKQRAKRSGKEDKADEFKISIIGTNVRSMTTQLTEKLSSGDLNGVIGIDIKA